MKVEGRLEWEGEKGRRGREKEVTNKVKYETHKSCTKFKKIIKENF